MKKYYTIIAIIIAVIVTSFCGCSDITKYTDDYPEIYNSFLEHSLGDYTILKKGNGREGGSFALSSWTIKYLWWDIGYTDKNGDEVTFRINNYDSFEEQIASHAVNIAGKYIEKDLRENYFKNNNLTLIKVTDEFLEANDVKIDSENQIFLRLGINHDEWMRDSGKVFYTKNGGMKLSRITPREMVDDWDCDFYFHVYIGLNDMDSFPAYQENLVPLFGYLSNYLGQEDFKVSLFNQSSNESSKYFSIYGRYNNSETALKWEEYSIRSNSVSAAEQKATKALIEQLEDSSFDPENTNLQVWGDWEISKPLYKNGVLLELHDWETPQELASYGYVFKLHSRIYLKGEKSDKEIQKMILPKIRYAADYLNQNTTPALILIYIHDEYSFSMSVEYDKLTDTLALEVD